MKNVLLASFFVAASAQPKLPTSAYAITTYTTADCSAAETKKAIVTIEGCNAYGNCCICPVGGGGSYQWKESSTTGLTLQSYASACDCSGSEVTLAQDWGVCKAQPDTSGLSTSSSMKTVGSVASDDIMFGFYSTSSCTYGTGDTAKGVFSRSTVAVSGDCVDGLPAAGQSTKVTYDLTVDPPTIKTEIFAAANCAGAAAATINGLMGQCAQVPSATATVMGATSCTDASACYVWVFPLGVFAPAAASSSVTTGVALTVAGATGVAAALLL